MGDHWRRLDRIPLTYSSLKWLQSVPGYSKLPWHEVVCVYSLLPVFLSLPTLHWSPSDTYILSLFLPFQSSPHYFFKTLWHTTLPPPPPRPPSPPGTSLFLIFAWFSYLDTLGDSLLIPSAGMWFVVKFREDSSAHLWLSKFKHWQTGQ